MGWLVHRAGEADGGEAERVEADGVDADGVEVRSWSGVEAVSSYQKTRTHLTGPWWEKYHSSNNS